MESISVIQLQQESKRGLVIPVMYTEIAKLDHPWNFVPQRQVDIAGQEIRIVGILDEEIKSHHLKQSMPPMNSGIFFNKYDKETR